MFVFGEKDNPNHKKLYIYIYIYSFLLTFVSMNINMYDFFTIIRMLITK